MIEVIELAVFFSHHNINQVCPISIQAQCGVGGNGRKNQLDPEIKWKIKLKIQICKPFRRPIHCRHSLLVFPAVPLRQHLPADPNLRHSLAKKCKITSGPTSPDGPGSPGLPSFPGCPSGPGSPAGPSMGAPNNQICFS